MLNLNYGELFHAAVEYLQFLYTSVETSPYFPIFYFCVDWLAVLVATLHLFTKVFKYMMAVHFVVKYRLPQINLYHMPYRCITITVGKYLRIFTTLGLPKFRIPTGQGYINIDTGETFFSFWFADLCVQFFGFCLEYMNIFLEYYA